MIESKNIPEILNNFLNIEKLRSIISIYPSIQNKFKIEYFDKKFKNFQCQMKAKTVSIKSENDIGHIKQIQQMQDMGFDWVLLLQSTFNSLFGKLVRDEVFMKIKKLSTAKNESLDSANDLVSYIFKTSKKNNSDFLIVNNAVGIFLQDHKYAYAYDNATGSKNNLINSQFSFAGLKVFIDYNISWDDTIIYMGKSTKQNNLGLYLAYNSHFLEYDYDKGLSKIKYKIGFIDNVKPEGFTSIKISPELIKM